MGKRFDTATHLSNGVQADYHIWLLYFYDRRPVRYMRRIATKMSEKARITV